MYSNSEIRKVVKPRDPILARQVEDVLDEVDLDPPECDDLEAIDDALEQYGIK